MVHEELYQKCLKAMGGTVPLGFREEFAKWHEAQGKEIWLRYDWIKHPGFYAWVVDEPGVDWHDGTEGITVWICEHGRVGHEKGKVSSSETGA